MKEPKENSVGTLLPGCPTALPSIADTSGEVSLHAYLSLIVVVLPDPAPYPKLYIPSPEVYAGKFTHYRKWTIPVP